MKKLLMTCLSVSCFYLVQVGSSGTNAEEISRQSINVSNIIMTVSMTNKWAIGNVVSICVSVKNQSNTNVYFPRGRFYFYDYLNIYVYDPQNRIISPTTFGRSIIKKEPELPGNGLILLMPGEDISMEFNLGRIFDLSKNGDYYLSVGTWVTKTVNMQELIKLHIDRVKFSVSDISNSDIYQIEKHLKGYGKGFY